MPIPLQRAADRLALANLPGDPASMIRTGRAERRVAMATKRGTAIPEGDAEAALWRISSRGAVGGKKAERIELNRGMDEINAWEPAAIARGEDDIASAYQNLSEQFAGSLDIGAGQDSPATLDAVRRYIEGRSTSTARYAGDIRMAAGQQRIQGFDKIALQMAETGSLVEALKMMEEEEDMLAAAQRGAIYGNPLAMLGSLAFGGGEEGRASSAAFGKSATETLATILKALGMAVGAA